MLEGWHWTLIFWVWCSWECVGEHSYVEMKSTHLEGTVVWLLPVCPVPQAAASLLRGHRWGFCLWNKSWKRPWWPSTQILGSLQQKVISKLSPSRVSRGPCSFSREAEAFQRQGYGIRLTSLSCGPYMFAGSAFYTCPPTFHNSYKAQERQEYEQITWTMGRIQPAACFCIACKLRMVFIFFKCWWKWKEYLITHEQQKKFKFQCP